MPRNRSGKLAGAANGSGCYQGSTSAEFRTSERFWAIKQVRQNVAVHHLEPSTEKENGDDRGYLACDWRCNRVRVHLSGAKRD